MKAYIVTIAFEELEPKVWRKVILPAGASFKRLHEIIQQVTNFDDQHTYTFELEDVYITNNEVILDEYKKKLFSGRKVKSPVRQKIDAYLEQEKTLQYTYDMGDDWRIQVTLNEIVDDYYFGFPTLLELEGIAPPENVTGAGGYAEFLTVYNNQKDPMFFEMREWAEAVGYVPTDSERVNYFFKSFKYQKTEWDKVDHDNYIILNDKYRKSDIVDLKDVREHKQILEYVKACVHLYGIIEYSRLLEIYNEQNKISCADSVLHWIVMTYDNKNELEAMDIVVEDDCFYHASLAGKQAEILRHGFGKPYYIPEKNELLKYTNPSYNEKTKQQEALISAVAKEFYKGNEKQVESQLHSLFLDLKRYDIKFSAIVSDFIGQFDFENIAHVNKFVGLIQNVANTSRLWENRGHTAREIGAMGGRNYISPLVNEPAQAEVKQGRNDPCDCGSGKKYKKCCGAN